MTRRLRVPGTAPPGDPEPRDAITALLPRARADLAELVAVRSAAGPERFPAEECARTALWVLDAFVGEGFTDARLVPTLDGGYAVLGARPCADPAAPTVLLYAHHAVPPAPDEGAWRTPPFELTEKDGRWYGRGAANHGGTVVAHLAALRAVGGDLPVNLGVVVEGSEGRGTGGLRYHVTRYPDDAIPWCDTVRADVEQRAWGELNLVVTVGTPAADPLAALVAVLATVRGRGGADAPPAVSLLGRGELWARPTVTATAAARISLRVPPGTSVTHAEAALADHLLAAAPRGVRVRVEVEPRDEPFLARRGGAAHLSTLAAVHPGTELVLMGVEEHPAPGHPPDESVDPAAIAGTALTEALFLRHRATAYRATDHRAGA